MNKITALNEHQKRIAQALHNAVQMSSKANVNDQAIAIDKELQYSAGYKNLEAKLAAVVEAMELFLERVDRYGNWNKETFFSNRYFASEMHEPIRQAHAALAKARGEK